MLAASQIECVRGNRRLFRDLSFRLEAHQALRVRGENGSGKTSLLRIVAGLSPAAFYRELGGRTNVPLIEKALPAVLSDKKLKQDALHPTADGHRVLAERAVGELKKIGLIGRR
jgi:ABC-type uncharacterized transport system fused permease/ATPase subunit